MIITQNLKILIQQNEGKELACLDDDTGCRIEQTGDSIPIGVKKISRSEAP